jgi:hypothetical protein
MSLNQTHQSSTVKSHHDLDAVIEKALEKIGGRKENDLCKFLPSDSGGYVHHFTLRKMKIQQPHELSELIKKYIVHTDTPGKVNPKQRAARGSRKKRDVLTLTRGDVERLLDISRQVGDKEMVAKLSPKRSLSTLRRDLMKSIRAGQVNFDLWNAYVECMSCHNLQAGSSGQGK